MLPRGQPARKLEDLQWHSHPHPLRPSLRQALLVFDMGCSGETLGAAGSSPFSPLLLFPSLPSAAEHCESSTAPVWRGPQHADERKTSDCCTDAGARGTKQTKRGASSRNRFESVRARARHWVRGPLTGETRNLCTSPIRSHSRISFKTRRRFGPLLIIHGNDFALFRTPGTPRQQQAVLACRQHLLAVRMQCLQACDTATMGCKPAQTASGAGAVNRD